LKESSKKETVSASAKKKDEKKDEKKEKDDDKSKNKKKKSAKPSSSTTAAAAPVSAAASVPISAKQSSASSAASSHQSSGSTPSRSGGGGGFGKKLVRLFSNASDMTSQAEADQQKSQFEHEKALLVMQHKAQCESFERQLREMTDKVDALKAENAELVQQRDTVTGERDKWEQRCLNQKKKIETLEQDAEKFVKMMSQLHYVPGKAVHNVREPSFCPQF
jgi:hypothetical protein